MTREVERSAIANAWWPIDVAVAWVLTRDRTFVERQWKRRGGSCVTVEIAVAANAISGQAIPLMFEGVDEAWAQLKGILEEGAVKVVGTPFRRLTDSSGSTGETTGSQREILDSEIGSLLLFEDGDDLCLVPEDWRVARGPSATNLRGYRNVQVRSQGLMHFFPAGTPTLQLPSKLMGPPADPNLPGEMSISAAAYWIASEGGSLQFDLRDQTRWQSAFDQLLPRISSGLVTAIGRKAGRGLAMVIDPANFAGVAVDYPYANTPMNLILCERPHIRCYGIVDSGEWETNFHDSLMGDHRRVPEYSHLQIRNSDLAKHFPFSSLRADAPVKTLQDKIREVAASLWPDGNRPVRIKERNLAIQAEFRIPPNERTIRRALNEKH